MSETFKERLHEYVGWMKAKNFSHDTIVHAELSVRTLAVWLKERSIERPVGVTRQVLEQYARHLFRLRKPSGEPLSFRTQYGYLSCIRSFFRFLARRNHVLMNPAADLEMPRLGRRLPRNVLTEDEVERVLLQPDLTKPSGIRDRAILETMYSTGLRRIEIVRLLVTDLDVERKTLFVKGKGNKDRVVPIGERAIAWIERYLSEVRPVFALESEEKALFITEYGKKMSEDGLSHRVTKYVNAADLGKDGSCHLFRHACATLMLERGADVRALQELLGHTKLDTTMIYTQVSIGHLKSEHARTHPSAKRPHERGEAEDPEEDAE
jgi:integrase/recombinase XerD